MSNYIQNFDLAEAVLSNLLKFKDSPELQELLWYVKVGRGGMLPTLSVIKVIPSTPIENNKFYRATILAKLLIFGHDTEAISDYTFKDYSISTLLELAQAIRTERYPRLRIIDQVKRYRRWYIESYELKVISRLIEELDGLSEANNV